MKNIRMVVAFCLALATLGGAVFAQAVAPPPPPAPPSTPAAPAATPATAPAAAPAAPAIQPRMDFVRPVPCIVPTMRLISPLTARLNMTDDQRTKVADLLTKSDADLKTKVEDQSKAASAYVAALTDPKASQDDLVAAATKSMKAETDVLLQRIQTLYALKALLTPEQNKQLCEFMTQATVPWTDRSRLGQAPLRRPAPAPASVQPAK